MTWAAIGAGAISVAGGIASSAIGGKGGLSGKESRGNWREAVRGVETAGNDLLGNNPAASTVVPSAEAFRNFVANIIKFSQDPYTYSDQFAAQQKAGYADDAWNGFRSALGQSDEQAGQAGQFRSSARANRSNALAQQLGMGIASNNRQVDTAQRSSRAQDIGQLGTLLQGLFNLRLQPEQAAAAVKTNTAQLPQSSNPLAALFGGIGTIAAAGGSAPGPTTYNPATGRYEQGQSAFGQFFNGLFGGGSSQASAPTLYRGDSSGSFLPGY